MSDDPNECQGCEGRGQLTVDGVAFATCDACTGTGKFTGERRIPSGAGSMADGGFECDRQRDMVSLHAALRRRRTGRGTA